jgi:hypothetical protein
MSCTANALRCIENFLRETGCSASCARAVPVPRAEGGNRMNELVKLVEPGSPRASQTAASSSSNWSRVLGAGLVVTAGVLVTAAIVDDCIPPFAGAADDPAAVSMAGAMVAAGLAMMGGTTANLLASTTPTHSGCCHGVRSAVGPREKRLRNVIRHDHSV